MILPESIAAHYKELEEKSKLSFHHWNTIDECLHTFSIFSKNVRADLSHYFLLYWESDHFLSQLDVTKSYILRDGIRYYVIYQNMLTPETIETNYKHVRVSFRKPSFLDFGFVIIRSVKE